MVHFLVNLRIWRDNPDGWNDGQLSAWSGQWRFLIHSILYGGYSLDVLYRLTSSPECEVFFQAGSCSVYKFECRLGTKGKHHISSSPISYYKVFLWPCRRLRLNRLPSVCELMHFPSFLSKFHLTSWSIMLKRTVNGVKARRSLLCLILMYPGLFKDHFCSRCQMFWPNQ